MLGETVYSGNQLEIYGVYKPQSTDGFNITMMDGSMLDLSDQNAAWNCKFSNSGYEFHVWTVDRLEDTEEAFARGVQTVTTNCAEAQLRAALEYPHLLKGQLNDTLENKGLTENYFL